MSALKRIRNNPHQHFDTPYQEDAILNSMETAGAKDMPENAERQLAKAAGATEQLKANDPMIWVGLMNTCKAQAEEVIMTELIYS